MWQEEEGAVGKHFPLSQALPPRLVDRVRSLQEGMGRDTQQQNKRPLKLENKETLFTQRVGNSPTNDSVAPDVFQGTFQKPAHLIFMTTWEGAIIIISLAL